MTKSDRNRPAPPAPKEAIGGWESPSEEFDRRSRSGEPEFADPAQAARWRTARRAAIDHVLALIAGSWWSDSLVLRGSLPLQAWVGERAREPADLDWVVVRDMLNTGWQYGNLIDLTRTWPAVADALEPADDAHGIQGTWEARHPSSDLKRLLEAASADGEAESLYGDLLERIRQRPEAPGGVLLDADQAYAESSDGGWSYHGPGVRLEVPWRASGLPPGRIRVDFATDETFSDPPELAALPVGCGEPPVVVQTASRELSLAWKILWLQVESEEDGGAQGKDLYDAVLLAEDRRTRLSTSLLEEVLSSGYGCTDADGLAPDLVRRWPMAWAQFQTEYPWVQGSAEEWSSRLSTALTSMFAAAVPTTADLEVGDSVTITDLEVGDSVTISGGPFATHQATVDEVSPHSKKVRVLVHAFHRETTIDLSFDQVRKN
ncbi:nucleotidyl transferase AbiEii/AbiGii toxin family protein [Streptomyces sp. NPDC056304]|uniref:nucleotidyl transferase AbiEii/AbiGii toxin family protein n=1 Tax=Streptomyces sp. NPDC056304 TaxID=3345778 RepID=UPI0035E154CC